MYIWKRLMYTWKNLEMLRNVEFNAIEAMQIILSSWNGITEVCLKYAFCKAEFQVNQFVDEAVYRECGE